MKLGKTDVEMPMAGLGTWPSQSLDPGSGTWNQTATEEAVELAMSLGYTHIDCALGYNNQLGVGKGLAKSGRARDTYFITSKIPGGLNASATKAALDLSLEQLFPGDKDAYVDLMLVHFPASWGGEGGAKMRVEEWKAMEAWQKTGKARALGVSHYCQKHIEDILAIPNTVPIAVNQVMYHVGMGTAGINNTDNKAYMEKQGITYEGFSPLCGPCNKTGIGYADNNLINGTLVSSIGKAHGKSGAQVSLKWQVQAGIPVIPKANNEAFLKENIDLFDWKLTDEEMARLTAAVLPTANGGSMADDASGDCDIL
jgi:diketogulonate reductase-like aldo/keto reductase